MIRPYIHDGIRVLDIGCADGALFRQHAPATGIGIDPDLEKPVDNGRYILVKGNFPEDINPGDRFDLITLLAVVEHIPEEILPKLAQDCRERLKPGGKILITVPDPMVDSILAVLVRLRLADGMSLEQHHGFDVRKVPVFFGQAGLTLLRHRRFQLGLNNLYVFSQ